MSDSNALSFLQLILNDNDNPTYPENNTNEKLCKVLTPGMYQ